MRILLTGANGQVGRCLKKQKPEHWEMIAADSQTLDITNVSAINNMVKNFEPDVIINAAGYTNLSAAEDEKEKEAVFAANATGTYNLAQAAAQIGIRFIHISSDYVFDGQKRMPYTENDYTNPLSVYAKSKLAGELLALAANPDSIIVRSSWVFSEYGNNFVSYIIEQAKTGQIAMPTDKIGCPTYAGDLAKLMIELAQRENAPRGIYHYCGNHAVNRFEFAQVVYQVLNQLVNIPAELIALQQEIHEHTPRPQYSVLSCEKIRALGYEPSDWKAALKHVILALTQNN